MAGYRCPEKPVGLMGLGLALRVRQGLARVARVAVQSPHLNHSLTQGNQMKAHALFAAEVVAVLFVVALVQKNFMNLPVVGEYLPGYTAR